MRLSSEAKYYLRRIGIIGVCLPTLGLFASAAFPGFQSDESRAFKSLTIGQTYLDTLQTGDIVYFSQPSFVPFPLKMLLSSQSKSANAGDYEHVGVIYRHPIENYPYIVEKSWRGLQVTNFEDRVLHSNCQDVMYRTLHFIRSHDTDMLASQYLDAQTKKVQYNPLKRASLWMYQMYALSRLGLRQWMAPRNTAPLQRVQSMEEINKLMAQEEKYSEFGIKKEQNHAFDEFASSHVEKNKTYQLTTRVNLYGEMYHLLKMLTQTDVKMNQLANIMTIDDKIVEAKPSSWQTWFQAPAVKKTVMTPQQTAELQLLLSKRKQFLTKQIEEKYGEYTAESRALLKPNLFNPASKGSPAAFQGAEFVIDFLEAIGIAMPGQDGVPFVTQAEFDQTIPTKIPTPKKAKYTQPVFLNNRDISALLEPTIDIPKAYETLAMLAPKSREYIPHDQRDEAFIKLKRGILGEEQHITVKFNQPPWEVTDVYTEE